VTRAVGGTRQKLSMVATVTNQGKARWTIIDGAFNHERLIEFLESLVKDTGTKIFLVLDNFGGHHCKPVKAWLAPGKCAAWDASGAASQADAVLNGARYSHSRRPSAQECTVCGRRPVAGNSRLAIHAPGRSSALALAAARAMLSGR
jgi:hypothetical protein